MIWPKNIKRFLKITMLVVLSCLTLIGCSNTPEDPSEWILSSDISYSDKFIETMQLAKLGHAESQYSIGAMYDLGQGAPQSKEDAHIWYRWAAEKGLAIAEYTLGAMYELGDIVPKDGEMFSSKEKSVMYALRWYRKAADHGYKDAKFRLAHLLESNPPELFGHSDRSPRFRSIYWYSLAEDGYPEAQYRLGLILSMSDDPYDLRDAFIWLSIAEINGIKSAREQLDRIDASVLISARCPIEIKISACIRNNYKFCDFFLGPNCPKSAREQ
jgi:TPR repeat protein